MEFREISVTVPVERLSEAEAIASMAASGGIYIEDYSDLEEAALEIAHIDLIDEDLLKRDRSSACIHIYLYEEENAAEAVSFLKDQFAACAIPFSLDLSCVNDADWKDNWKKYFKCTEIGSRLTIRPSWESYENKENRVVLELDPGAAFGTGTHATTLLCLSFLDSYISGGESVLDIGCGSGILSIAAVLLGAESADGVDIDPVAVKVSLENAERNGIAEKTNFICGDLAEKVSGKYRVVCANIVADVIIRLCNSINNYLEDDGLFLCSGIINPRAQEVLAAIKSTGLSVVKVMERDGWTAIVAAKQK